MSAWVDPGSPIDEGGAVVPPGRHWADDADGDGMPDMLPDQDVPATDGGLPDVMEAEPVPDESVPSEVPPQTIPTNTGEASPKITPDDGIVRNKVFTPAMRSALYGVLMAVGGLLLTLGIASPEQVERALNIADKVLNIAMALGGAITVFSGAVALLHVPTRKG